MHEYYAKKAPKLKKEMNGLLKPISRGLTKHSKKEYADIFSEIWEHYRQNMLENFPYIGGDKVSGTGNLTGAYCFVSMGEVLKRYNVQMEEIGHLMVLAYERRFNAMPGIIKAIARKYFTNVKSLNKKYLKKDAQNAANAAENPGSFETKTIIPPEKGLRFQLPQSGLSALGFRQGARLRRIYAVSVQSGLCYVRCVRRSSVSGAHLL